VGMDDLFDRFVRDWPWPGATVEPRGWAPAVDMVDRKNEIVVRLDVPGLSERDIDVSIDNGVLTISGERRDDWEAQGDDYYCSERWAGSFSRALMLPQGVDAEGVKATLKHGILEVHIPKTKEAAEKRIEVKAA
jgi:HSP20 family protein